jgi:hypothetical protein
MSHHRSGTQGWRRSAERVARLATRSIRSYMPGLSLLESRALLAGGPDIAAEAAALTIDSPLSGTVGPLSATYYQIVTDVAGKLTVTLSAPGFPARLSLVDATGQPLVESDGPASVADNRLLDVSVPAGNNFLEVESLGAGGDFEITADLVATNPAFQNASTAFPGSAAIAVGDFNDDGAPDLVAPDGIHLGVGDGTFQSATVGGGLAYSDWNVTAIAAGQFGSDGGWDIALTEVSPDGTMADVRVLAYQAGGDLELVGTYRIDAFSDDPYPVAIEPIDFGNGIVDLVVADNTTGNITILLGDGTGNFTLGPVLPAGVNPTALVAGRFGDGHVDLIVADQGDTSAPADPGAGLSLFQSNGPRGFQLASTMAFGAAPSAVVAGDFNGDGALDLAVAEANSSQVSVLLNNGKGAFAAPTSYSVGQVPLALVTLDIGNGQISLATANQNSNDVSVLLGKGDGTFLPQLRFGAGSSPAAIVAADFNGDHRNDLAVANQSSSDISVLLGLGDGTFQDQVANPIASSPSSVITADLNHDGHVDVITTDLYSGDISVLLGAGDGTFEAARFFPAGASPTAVVAGDFNGDGRVDLAVTDGGSLGRGQGVSILLGNGDGTFRPPVLYPAGMYPNAIVAKDFTGDGVLDLAIANRDSNDVSILRGDGFGGFQPLDVIPLGDQVEGPSSIMAGDFTGDGATDLAVVGESTGTISIIAGDGRGGFKPPILITLNDAFNTLTVLAAGDFTGDGNDDLAAVLAGTDGENRLAILVSVGGGAFGRLPLIDLGPNLSPSSIVADHLFGGAPLDLAITDQYSHHVLLLAGDGHGGFTPGQALDVGSAYSLNAIATGDFTGNGLVDLAVAIQSPNSVAIELNLGLGQFAPPGPVGISPHDTPLVADLNGDGLPDVAIVNGAGDILFRQGQAGRPGSFSPPFTVNPGRPSRDIAAFHVQGETWLASVDANDNAVSLFAYSNGRFDLIKSLPTGMEPAQIVAADFMGNGNDGLVIRNAGDGTLTVEVTDSHGVFMPPVTLTVGSGISDVSVADVNQDGLPDLLLTNQIAGVVEVVLNQGAAGFSPATIYRAGAGRSALIGGSSTTSPSLFSQEGTSGAVAAALSPGGPIDLVALNTGSETIGVLQGLGAGRFANPTSLPTAGATIAVRVGDFNNDGYPDLAILGTNGLSIWFGFGDGVFAAGKTYDVGPSPTGLSIADTNADGLPDLVVGNAFGDVIVLQSIGNGLFEQPAPTDQSVTLAVDTFPGQNAPTVVIANQALDRVTVQHGAGAPQTVVADRTTGLLVPGKPVLADLNGDGIPDLVVPNSGGNSVFVYPGLPAGGFGPSLNNGNGFFVGTNPVSVLVADVNGDGRADLITANKGSNDVSILLNQAAGAGITFAQGPRLSVGSGPVALLLGNFNRDKVPDLLVSDSASNDLMLLPGRGNGFFDDVSPTVITLTESPGQIFAGSFTGGSSLDVVALDPGTSEVTLISDLRDGAPTFQSFSTGGFDPVAGFSLLGSDGFLDLVVANRGDGSVALLEGGLDGLSLGAVNSSLAGLGLTGLAFASLHGNDLSLFAVAEGQQAASLLVLFTPSPLPFGVGAPGLSLLPLEEQSLPIIATFVQADVSSSSSAVGTASAGREEGISAVSLGQGPFGNKVDESEASDDEEFVSEPGPVPPAALARSVWKRVMIGLDQAFEEFRRAMDQVRRSIDDPRQDEENDEPAPQPAKGPVDRVSSLSDFGRIRMIDAAIDSLSQATGTKPPIRTLASEPSDGTAKLRFEPVFLTWCAAQLVTHQRLQLAPAHAIPRSRRTGPRRRAWLGRFLH